jgi:hypothetical protein
MTSTRARESIRASLVTAALAVVMSPAAAAAQATPKFEFAKPGVAAPPSAPTVEWKAQVKGGVAVMTGNSQSRNGTFAATASRKEGNNKLTLEGGMAYGRSSIVTPVIDTTTTPNTIMRLDRRSVETTNNWVVKTRYDRFLTSNNAAYVSAQGAGDRIAGKSFFGGGQAGYSRQLLNSPHQLMVVELGYDVSHERYVSQPGKTLEPVTVHSARLFVGETLKLSPATGITASGEALVNLNKESNAIDVDSGQPGVDPLGDTRVVGKLGLTTTLLERLSIGFGVTVRYDQNPALLPVPSGSPAGLGFAPGVQLFAGKVDTLTEATLIYTFL